MRATALLVVADTSSLVRAALNAASAAGRLIDRLLIGSNGDVVVSPGILMELTDLPARPKFRMRLAPDRQRRFLLRLNALAVFVTPAERVTACRDPADNMVLEAALAAAPLSGVGIVTIVIISDDRDLLSLDPWRGIRIIKPEAALAMIEDTRC